MRTSIYTPEELEQKRKEYRRKYYQEKIKGTEKYIEHKNNMLKYYVEHKEELNKKRTEKRRNNKNAEKNLI